MTLTDDDGTSALTTVAEGVEVEILAWRPRRGADTRYRVVATNGGVEGWLGAKSLQRRQPPLAPKAAETAAPSGQLARRSPAVAAGVAMKTIDSPKSTRRGKR